MSQKSLSVPTAKQCKDFLESVVNGEDCDPVSGQRDRFRRLYLHWFPEEHLEGEALRVVLLAWKAHPVIWWRRDSFANENPKDYFEWSAAVLRDKLRFIWLSEPKTARDGMKRLMMDVYSFRRLSGTQNEPWREKTLEACNWLEKWLMGRKGSRLLLCKNPECADTKYFIRGAKEPNKKYCSSPCSQRGEELIRLERRSKRQPNSVLSSEALEAIRQGQRNRRNRETSTRTKSANPKAGRVKGG